MADTPTPLDARWIKLDSANSYRPKRLIRAVKLNTLVQISDSLGKSGEIGKPDDWLCEDNYGRRFIVVRDDFDSTYEPVVVIEKT